MCVSSPAVGLLEGKSVSLIFALKEKFTFKIYETHLIHSPVVKLIMDRTWTNLFQSPLAEAFG